MKRGGGRGHHQGEEVAPEGEGEAEREAEGGDAREGVRGGRGGVSHLVTVGVLGRAHQNAHLRQATTC